MLSLIVAMTRDDVIGRGGQLPWRLSADLKRFKALTMGHSLIMGRKTFDSLGRVLPGRTNIVITRQQNLRLPEGVLVAHGLDEALALASDDGSPFVIGGAEIFAQVLDRVERMYVTWVEAAVAGDTRFPAWNRAQWRLAGQEYHAADDKNEHAYTFAIYDRRPRPAPARDQPSVANAPATSLPAATAAASGSPSSKPAGLQSPLPKGTAAMTSELSQQLLDLNQQLLVAIVNGDWKTYVALCDESITCFEPEARGQLVAGMPFHKYYFDLPAAPQKPSKQVTMSQPHVRLMGDQAAVVSYVRLTQSLDGGGAPQTGRMEETRVWQKIGGQWKHVHFHRSPGS
jgi:dihydrofolate reductase/ketosteroid isomerase-like protein